MDRHETHDQVGLEESDGVVDSRIVGPIHEAVGGIQEELGRLRLEVRGLEEELAPILKPREDEPSEPIAAAPHAISPHREVLLSILAAVGDLRNDVARLRGRVEV